MDLPVTKFGAVTLGAQIARGGTADIFVGKTEQGPLVVIKRFRGDTSAMGALEAGVYTKLADLPGVPEIYGHGPTSSGYAIVMQLLAGQRLSGLAPLPWSRAQGPVVRMLRALIAVHARDVVHGDLNPNNIIVDEAGRPALIDFGAVPFMRATGALVGAPGYTAPEVVVGAAPTAASDIYALGMCIYYLLHGKAPFAGLARPNEAFQQALLGRALEFAAALPRAVVATVEAMTRRDPERRCSARTALERLIRAEPSTAEAEPSAPVSPEPPQNTGVIAVARPDSPHRSGKPTTLILATDGPEPTESTLVIPRPDGELELPDVGSSEAEPEEPVDFAVQGATPRDRADAEELLAKVGGDVIAVLVARRGAIELWTRAPAGVKRWKLPGHPRLALVDLLVELFVDFRELTAHLPAWMRKRLPGGNLPLVDGVDMTVEFLVRYGEIDDEFFESLAREFPRRELDVRAVQAIWAPAPPAPAVPAASGADAEPEFGDDSETIASPAGDGDIDGTSASSEEDSSEPPLLFADEAPSNEPPAEARIVGERAAPEQSAEEESPAEAASGARPAEERAAAGPAAPLRTPRSRGALVEQVAALASDVFDRLVGALQVPLYTIPPALVPALQRAEALVDHLERNDGDLARLAAEVDGHGATVVPHAFKRLAGDPAALLGEVVSGHRLLRVLGKGGSGVVYEAQLRSTGAIFALKLTYPLPHVASHVMAETWSMIHGLQAAAHPAIVTIREFGEATHDSAPPGRERNADGVSLFMRMELVAGVHFDAWASRKLRAPGGLAAVLRAVATIADCMHRCHETSFITPVGVSRRGVYHGDIKPANVLMRADDGPAIVDFLVLDVQRLLKNGAGRELERQDLTHVTAALGTPGFMAAEQAQRGEVSAAADIYSLGVTTAWALLARRTPGLAGNLPIAVQWARSQWRPDAPAGLAPLQALVASMLAEDPAARPRSMAAVRDELLRFAADERLRGA